MTDELEGKRGPGRPRTIERVDRVEETKTQRRRRSDTGTTAGLKMFVHPEAKDPNYEYRIVNDKPGRIHALTVNDDWEVVTTDKMNGKHDPARQYGEGTQVQFLAGKGDDGKAMSAYLLRKPKDFYKQDKAKEQQAIKAQEQEMRRGPVTSAEGLSGAEAYVPGGADGMSGTNTIGQRLVR